MPGPGAVLLSIAGLVRPGFGDDLPNTQLTAQSRMSGVRLIAGFAGHEVQSASITAIRSSSTVNASAAEAAGRL